MLLDHIDLRVTDLAQARPLYDALMSAMGYTKQNADEESVGYHLPIADESRNQFIWLVEESGHAPNGTRIAFAASSRAEVDRLATVVHAAGARAFEPAHLAIEYSPTYYATFFEDACGNKLEICHRSAK